MLLDQLELDKNPSGTPSQKYEPATLIAGWIEGEASERSRAMDERTKERTQKRFDRFVFEISIPQAFSLFL